MHTSRLHAFRGSDGTSLAGQAPVASLAVQTHNRGGEATSTSASSPRVAPQLLTPRRLKPTTPPPERAATFPSPQRDPLPVDPPLPPFASATPSALTKSQSSWNSEQQRRTKQLRLQQHRAEEAKQQELERLRQQELRAQELRWQEQQEQQQLELERQEEEEEERLRPPPPWDYKYPHTPCTSAVHPSERDALKLEALFQVVLRYPRLPPRLYRFLPRLRPDRTLAVLTTLVERLADHFGREVTLLLLRNQPYVLDVDFEVILARLDAARSMLDLRPPHALMLLKKNPLLVCMDISVVRARFDALHHTTMLGHDGVKAMVSKNPRVLNYTPRHVQGAVNDLGQLCSQRDLWQWCFERLTPSLLNHFLQDRADLLIRLEFLLYAGKGHAKMLRELFMPANNVFLKRHGAQYWPWLRAKQHLMLRAAARQAAVGHRVAAAAACARRSVSTTTPPIRRPRLALLPRQAFTELSQQGQPVAAGKATAATAAAAGAGARVTHGGPSGKRLARQRST